MLSKRLAMIADHIQGDVVADVGCDHGILSCQLAMHGKQVLATDISSLCLDKCRILAEQLQCSHNMSFFVGDGLSPLEGQKTSDIVLSGMGAHEILRILQNSPIPLSDTNLLIQCASRVPILRQELSHLGLEILHEDMVYENHRFYFLVIAKFSQTAQHLLPWQAEIGPKLYQNRHPLLPQWARHRLALLQSTMRYKKQHEDTLILQNKLKEVCQWPQP